MSRPTLATLLASLTLLLATPIARAQEPASEEGPPERLGPVTLETERATFQPGFGTQLRATVLGDADGHEGRFVLHRARPSLRAAFLDGRLRFRIHADVAPRALELLDFYVEGDPGAAVTVRLGIAKIPFALHWDQGYLRLALVDWPLTERWIGGGRQLGLTLASRQRTGWVWAAGIYQGQTLRASNGQRFTTAYGERRVNYLDLREHTPLGQPHPELVGRLAYQARTERLEGAVALSVAWDLRPTYAVDETLRLGLDGHLLLSALDLRAGAFLAVAEEGDGDPMVAYGASLLEAEVRPHPRVGLAARHSAIVRSAALRADARERADGLIANAPGPEDAATMRDRYEDVGRIRAEHETTIGVNVYLVGDDLKLQTDVSWLRTAGPDRDGWRVRAQLGFGF